MLHFFSLIFFFLFFDFIVAFTLIGRTDLHRVHRASIGSSMKPRVRLKRAYSLISDTPRPSCLYCHSVGLSTSVSRRTAYLAEDCPVRYSLHGATNPSLESSRYHDR